MNDPKRIAVVAFGLVFLGICTLGIKGHMDSNGYKNQVNYTTAIKTSNQDDFNYTVDSQQGRVLASGEFKTNTGVKFPEMSKKFTYVDRVKEHYTMHTRQVCSGSGKTHSCHTEVYYTWDQVDSNETYAKNISFMGREYRPTLFNFSQYNKKADACAFTAKGTGTGWLDTKHGCIDGSFYLDDNDRYVYSTVPTSFNATFLATTYGGLKPFNEKSITLQDKSIEQVLKDIGKYQLIGFWVVTVLLICLAIGAGLAAYSWVMSDGVWSVDR